MRWSRHETFLRRVLLEKGHTSVEIDRGDFTAADAQLLLQPVEAVQEWASSGEESPSTDASQLIKSGVLKEHAP